MSSLASASVLAPAKPAALVGNRAAHGAFWTVFFSLLNKLGTVASQIALAWFLYPADFGLVAMALAVTSFASIVCGSNLRTILIQQHDDFASHASQVFWLSLSVNLAVAAVMIAVSPLAQLVLKAPGLAGLIIVAALAVPIQGLNTIYSAALYRDLRFRRISGINLCAGLLQNASAVLFAALGFGSYSLVLPLVVMALWLGTMFRLSAGRISIAPPAPRLWFALLAPSLWVMANALFGVLQNYGPNFILGLFHNATITGYYYWGFALASQAVYLLATNLQAVFFPVLAKLNDDQLRQSEAVRKVCQTLTVAVVPICILQILLARPLITFVFHERWLPSIGVVQWLSLAMLTQPLTIVASAVLLARGKFRLLATTAAISAFSVTIAAAVGSHLGQQTEIARWTGICLLLTNLAAGVVAFRELNQGIRALGRVIVWPFTFGIVTALLSWWVAVQTRGHGPIWQALAVSAICLATYGLLVRTFIPEVAENMLRRFSFRRVS